MGAQIKFDESALDDILGQDDDLWLKLQQQAGAVRRSPRPNSPMVSAIPIASGRKSPRMLVPQSSEDQKINSELDKLIGSSPRNPSSPRGRHNNSISPKMQSPVLSSAADMMEEEDDEVVDVKEVDFDRNSSKIKPPVIRSNNDDDHDDDHDDDDDDHDDDDNVDFEKIYAEVRTLSKSHQRSDSVFDRSIEAEAKEIAGFRTPLQGKKNSLTQLSRLSSGKKAESHRLLGEVKEEMRRSIQEDLDREKTMEQKEQEEERKRKLEEVKLVEKKKLEQKKIEEKKKREEEERRLIEQKRKELKELERKKAEMKRQLELRKEKEEENRRKKEEKEKQKREEEERKKKEEAEKKRKQEEAEKKKQEEAEEKRKKKEEQEKKRKEEEEAEKKRLELEIPGLADTPPIGRKSKKESSDQSGSVGNIPRLNLSKKPESILKEKKYSVPVASSASSGGDQKVKRTRPKSVSISSEVDERILSKSGVMGKHHHHQRRESYFKKLDKDEPQQIQRPKVSPRRTNPEIKNRKKSVDGNDSNESAPHPKSPRSINRKASRMDASTSSVVHELLSLHKDLTQKNADSAQEAEKSNVKNEMSLKLQEKFEKVVNETRNGIVELLENENTKLKKMLSENMTIISSNAPVLNDRENVGSLRVELAKLRANVKSMEENEERHKQRIQSLLRTLSEEREAKEEAMRQADVKQMTIDFCQKELDSKDGKIEELNGQIALKQEVIDILGNETESMTTLNNSQTERINSLEEQQVQKEQAVKAMVAKMNADFKEEKEVYEKVQSELKEKISALESDKSSLKSEVEGLNTKYAELEAEGQKKEEKYKFELDRLEKSISAITSGRGRLEEIKLLHEEMDRNKVEWESLKSDMEYQIQELTQENEGLAESNNQLVKALEETGERGDLDVVGMALDAQDYEGRIRQFEETTTSQLQLIQSQEEVIDAQVKDLERAADEINDLNEKIEDLEQKLDNAEHDRTLKAEEISTLKKILEGLKTTKVSNEENLEKKIEDLSRSLVDTTEERDALKAAKFELEKELNNVTTEMSNLNQKHEEDLAELKGEKQSLKERLTEAIQERWTLETELRKKEEDGLGGPSAAGAGANPLRAQLQQTEEKVVELERKIKDLTRRKEDTEADMRALKIKHGDLIGQLKTKDEENDKLRKGLQILTSQVLDIEELEAELLDAESHIKNLEDEREEMDERIIMLEREIRRLKGIDEEEEEEEVEIVEEEVEVEEEE